MDELLRVLQLSKPLLEIETLKASKDLYGEGIIDSLDILVILDEINAAYGIEITGADFSREDFYTVENIYELVKRHGGA